MKESAQKQLSERYLCGVIVVRRFNKNFLYKTLWTLFQDQIYSKSNKLSILRQIKYMLDPCINSSKIRFGEYRSRLRCRNFIE